MTIIFTSLFGHLLKKFRVRLTRSTEFVVRPKWSPQYAPAGSIATPCGHNLSCDVTRDALLKTETWFLGGPGLVKQKCRDPQSGRYPTSHSTAAFSCQVRMDSHKRAQKAVRLLKRPVLRFAVRTSEGHPEDRSQHVAEALPVYYSIPLFATYTQLHLLSLPSLLPSSQNDGVIPLRLQRSP